MTFSAPRADAVGQGSAGGFQHVLLPTNDPQGQPVLAVIAKRTYQIRSGDVCIPAGTQLPLFSSDKFFDGGDPLITSCEYETDFYPYKPRCDVVVNGFARTPDKRPVRSMRVEAYVGRQGKAIQVFGDRHCRYAPGASPLWTDPEPFTEIPLRYERAYGGVDVRSREDTGALIYPRNPIGKGYAVLNTAAAVDGLPLPNLEDPRNLLTRETLVTGDLSRWQNQPLSQSFGWHGKSWFPRCMYAGVMPEHLSLYEQTREVSEGYVAPDQLEAFKRLKMPMMDFRFFNGAPVEMQMEALAGGEPVLIKGMRHTGDLSFPLPEKAPVIAIDIGAGFQTPTPVLQTVLIDTERQKLYMAWSGAISYPGPERMHELPTLEVQVAE
jgi:hypothetical protein